MCKFCSDFDSIVCDDQSKIYGKFIGNKNEIFIMPIRDLEYNMLCNVCIQINIKYCPLCGREL